MIEAMMLTIVMVVKLLMESPNKMKMMQMMMMGQTSSLRSLIRWFVMVMWLIDQSLLMSLSLGFV